MHSQTIIDLQEDFNRILVLAQSARKRISDFNHQLESCPEFYHPSMQEYLLTQTARLGALFDEIVMVLEEQELSNIDEVGIQNAIAIKTQLTHHMRAYHAEMGTLFTEGDWQSPTFDHTQFSQAGKLTGRIRMSENDYKRDLHQDSFDYEALFVREYLDFNTHLSPRAFLTASGMAALSTVVNYLTIGKHITGPVMMGKSSYFQGKWIFEHTFGDNLYFFDESKTEETIEMVKKIKPKIFFIDTLCNSQDIPVANLKALIEGVSKYMSVTSYLVIDNTAMTTAVQPLLFLPSLIHPRYILVESLVKYHQFGMDKINGGIILTSFIDAQGMVITRMQLGTNLNDTSVQSLPRPNRSLLDARQQRLTRNAMMLATALDKYLQTHINLEIQGIAFPGLPSHACYEWTKDMTFHGSYFAIKFRLLYQNQITYSHFINKVMKLAAQKGVALHGGTSFGMDVTRIYVTGRFATDLVKPFIRISVGTETEYEMKKIIEVFIEAMK